MVLKNIGKFTDIGEYVNDKIHRFKKEDKNCKTLFRYMFSERENTMAELSDGYRIKKISYGECHDKILRITPSLANKLEFAEKGSMVGIYMANSVEWIQIFWSILMCGYRPLLMNSRLHNDTLEKIIHDYGVCAVISDNETFSVPSFFATDIIANAEESCDADSYTWADEVVFMSSGTSDNVKLCFYTGENLFYQVCDSGNIINNCPQIKEHYEGELKQLTLLPFYHIFGFIAVYIWFGFFSRTFVFLKDMRPQTIQNTIKKHKVTHIFAVPLVWDTVCRAALRTIKARGKKTYAKFRKGLRISNTMGSLGQRFAKKAFREVRDNLFGDSVRFMISGGSSIRPEVLAFFNGIGYHLANGYGMTEVGITSVERSSSKKLLNSATIGAPFGLTEYKIDEKTGELLIKSKTMASRIVQNKEETVTDYGKFFNTRDLVSVRGDRYYIDGRKDDLIVCENGENLNPVLAEGYLKIKGCDSFCIFADRKGIPTLLISAPNCFTQEHFDDIRAHATEALREAKLDNEIKHVAVTSDPLLVGSEFKISRQRIAKRYSEGMYSVFDAQDSYLFEQKLSRLESEVRGYFAEVLKKTPDAIDVNANFFLDLGGTSLDYFTLMDIIKTKYDTELPMNEGRTLSSVKELCDFLKKKKAN